MAYPILKGIPRDSSIFDATRQGTFKFIQALSSDDEAFITAYQILVYKKDNTIVYDSGKVSDLTYDAEDNYTHIIAANTLTNGFEYYWKVKVWNNDTIPKEGPYSGNAYFSCASIPSIVISTASQLTSAVLALAWNFICADKQSTFKAILKQGTTIIAESGLVAASSTAYIFNPVLTSGNYTVELQATSEKGMSATATTNLTANISTVAPNKPTLALNLVGNKVSCTISNTDDVFYNLLQRKLDNKEWITIAKLNKNGSYEDYNFNAEKDVEYRVVAVGGNLLKTESNIKTIKYTLKNSAQIYKIDDVQNAVELIYNYQMNESFGIEKVLTKFNGRKRPIAEIGDNINRVLNIDYTTRDYDDINKLREMESISTLYFRDNRGVGMYCTFTPDSLKFDRNAFKSYKISFSLTEIDYNLEG